MNALLERASVAYGDAAVTVANFVLAEIAAKVAIEKADNRQEKHEQQTGPTPRAWRHTR